MGIQLEEVSFNNTNVRYIKEKTGTDKKRTVQ